MGTITIIEDAHFLQSVTASQMLAEQLAKMRVIISLKAENVRSGLSIATMALLL
jgi:hypothetical protein